jgi:spermidine/putrescine transport system permease protein
MTGSARHRQRRIAGNALLLPGALWLIVLFLVPLAVMVAVSFGTTNIVNQPVYGWNPGNYAQILHSDYLQVAVRTLVYALITTAVSLVVSYPVAYVIARYGGRAKGVLICLILLPWLVDYLIRIYAWVVLLSNQGVVNSFLAFLGVHGNPPVQFLNTPLAVIGGLVYGYFPFMVLPIYGTLEQLDGRLIEAGRDLYGSRWATFRHVTWPLSRAAAGVGCLLVFLPVLGDFATAQLLGGTGTFMLGNLIGSQFLESGSPNLGAVLTVLLSVVLLVAIVVAGSVLGKRNLERVL